MAQFAAQKEVDLERVSQLFDSASDGTDRGQWAKRFKDYSGKILAKHKHDMAPAELISLKYDLLKIVEERLDARCAKHEVDLKDAITDFHSETKKLFQQALKLAADVEDSSLKSPKKSLDASDATLKLDITEDDNASQNSEDEMFSTIMATPFNGVASFVAAARKQPAEKSVFSRDSIMNFDFPEHNEQPEVEDEDISKSFMKFGDNLNSDYLVHQANSKYTKIHTNCKYRLFNLLDIEKPEKVMTLNQLREIMTACIEGKRRKDERCRASNLQMLTLENYLFEFLEARYNSDNPNEIKEWFVALSKAINKFGVFDSDICIFGKMLRNTLAESFPEHQKVLRGTADKCLKEEVSANVWNTKMYNGIPFKAFEKVVYHMFNQKDGGEIMKRVKDPLPKTGKRGVANLEALARDHVRYQHAIEVLMTFNMNLQDDFLHDFIITFRKIDAGKDGTLNSNEINDLVNRFGTVETVREGSSAYTLLVDAKASTLRSLRRARRLTFSETVDHFTDLLSARWSVTGKKGCRYQCHETLKAQINSTIVQEKQPEQAEHDKLKSALKKAASKEKQVSQPETKSNIKAKRDASGSLHAVVS
jgi:hypothetical protein